MAKKKGKKKKTFKINTSGDGGKNIDEKKTRKPYVKKRVTNSTRKSINQAAVQKFGSRKKAKKKNAIVSKGTKFNQLSNKQKKSIGVKGTVNTTKELNALRQAIGYKVDRTSDKAGSIRFAIASDKQRGQDLAKEYKNKPTAAVISKMTTNERRMQNAKDQLRDIRRNKGGALNATDLGFGNEFGELQGQFNQALDRINNYDPAAGLRDELKDLKDARQLDRAAYGEEIGNLNTMINNLQMDTKDLVSGYETKIADDRQAYNDSLGLLKDAYTLQEQQTAEMNKIYADQNRRANNMRRAYIPSSNQVAGNPMVGDRRKGRKAADRKSALSSLTISTGLGRNANPLAGLQLA